MEFGPCFVKNNNKVANVESKTKMTQIIREVVARLSGKAIVYAKCSDIKGRKSGGTRDSSGKDWYQAPGPTGGGSGVN